MPETLGPKYSGRRFLRYAELVDLGIVNNRGTLSYWIERGAFPAGIRIGGRSGRTLVWSVDEIVAVLAQRVAERSAPPTKNPDAAERDAGGSSESLQPHEYRKGPALTSSA